MLYCFSNSRSSTSSHSVLLFTSCFDNTFPSSLRSKRCIGNWLDTLWRLIKVTDMSYRQDLDRHLVGPLSIERLNNFWVAAQRKNFFDTRTPHLLPSIW